MTGTEKTACANAAGNGFIGLATALLLSIALAGCNTTAQETTASVPSDYRQRHPIAISEADQSLKLFIGSKRAGLTPAQRADVLSFAANWRREATGGILIDQPVGSSNAAAASEALHEVRALLTASGVPATSIATRTYSAGPGVLPPVLINYPRIAANAGPCGLWPYDLGPAFERNYNENTPYWNHGCASQRNLAAMVENPADLVQPRGETPIYEGRRTIVLDKWRKGESTSATLTNPNKGKITDIGQ
jgi:pilus assembly protein CpaD